MKRGHTILYAEDHRETRFVYTDTLEYAGYRVLAVPDGRQALEALRDFSLHQRHPDLLLTDYHMPDVNGLQLIRCIRADHRLKAMPIILYSAADYAAIVHDHYLLHYGATAAPLPPRSLATGSPYCTDHGFTYLSKVALARNHGLLTTTLEEQLGVHIPGDDSPDRDK